MIDAVAKPWFVYIVRCADDSLYTGITTDLMRRCEQHNRSTGARYTRSRGPVTLVYHESLASRSLALKREYAIKTLSRAEKESLIGPAKKPRAKATARTSGRRAGNRRVSSTRRKSGCSSSRLSR